MSPTWGNFLTVRSHRHDGRLPDLPRRGLLFSVYRRVPSATQDSVDLRSLCSSVESQGAPGCCTVQARAGSLEFFEKKGVPFNDPSHLFRYDDARAILGL